MTTSYLKAIKTEVEVFDQDMLVKMNTWLSKKGRSLQMLCDLTHNRWHTLRDIRNGKSHFSNLHSVRLTRLISVFDGISPKEAQEKYSEVLKYSSRNEVTPADKIDDLSNEERFTSEIVSSLSDPIALAIYTMATSPNGVTEEQIKNEFGAYGIKAADNLIENKILMKSHRIRTYVAINQHLIEMDREKAKALIPVANKFYNSQHKNQDRNLIYFRSTSVNREALLKIYAVHVEAMGKIVEILKEEKSLGNIPFYSFLQMDTFIDKLPEEA